MTAPAAGFTTRFAPAPTGWLHLGHAVNAVWVWGLARAFGGRVLLRIEDHDRGRCRPEYERGILDDLDWLGLVPDGAGTEVFRRGRTAQRQGDNGARYEAWLAKLEAHGLAYPCTCSRADIARAHGRPLDREHAAESAGEAAGRELRYPGTCRARRLDPTATLARRVVMEPGHPEPFIDLLRGPQLQDPDLQCGDLLVRDRHANWTYQFAVVVDDFEQGVDLVIRGEDLLDSTGRQRRLARLLGRREPPRFLHHPLVTHPDGRKLSKSSGDMGLRELRAAGRTPAEVLGMAAHLGGLQPEPAPADLAQLAALVRRRFEAAATGPRERGSVAAPPRE